MKHTKNILGAMLLTAVAAASTSCVDDTKLLFNVEKPASIAILYKKQCKSRL